MREPGTESTVQGTMHSGCTVQETQVQIFRHKSKNQVEGTRYREQGTGNQAQGTRHREPDTGNQTQGTRHRELDQGTRHWKPGKGNQQREEIHGTKYRAKGTGQRKQERDGDPGTETGHMTENQAHDKKYAQIIEKGTRPQEEVQSTGFGYGQGHIESVTGNEVQATEIKA
jgi:hypothetical protein